MPNKKKHTPSRVAVDSTGCSRIKSYLSHGRPPPPPPPIPSKPYRKAIPQQQQPTSNSTPLPPYHNGDGSSDAQDNWERSRHLELELNQLDKWLNTEKRLAGCLNNATTGEGPIDTELMRSTDGSYIHEVKKMGRPWGRLVIELSSPTIAENGSTATEVMRAMASMDMEALHDCLVESMPMGDISGCDPGEIQMKTVVLGSEDGFMEAIVLGAIEKIEWLVMEGLRIQMGSSRRVAKDVEKREKEISTGCVVLVLLIQVRDPNAGYEAVGKVMIGLIDASAAKVEGSKYHIEGVQVAGIKCANNRNDGEDFMWSASMKGWNCVRNPDMFFTQKSY